MLLQALNAYAARLPTAPAMYQQQPVRYVILLGPDGTYRPPIVERTDPKTKRGMPLLAPYVKRANKIKPRLLADTAEYVLGVSRPESRPERVEAQHAQFVEMVQDCAKVTADPRVAAVATFLSQPDLQELDRPDTFDPSATITFSVDGVFPIELPIVRRYWATVQGAAEADDAGGETEAAGRMHCIVCGRLRPVLQRHPLKIRGIPGGQAGKDLISANNEAFESYGLDNSLIAPTCHACAEGYGVALNALLSDPTTSLRFQESVYAFWAADPTDLQPGVLLAEPEEHPSEVRELINAARSGRSATLNLGDPNAFYALCLGPSGARVVVRDWINTTVGEAQRQLGHYFAVQELVDYDGMPGAPLSARRLANATVRDPRKDAPPGRIQAALLRLALAGSPLPDDLLFQAVRRIRADGSVRRNQVALIKMVFGWNGEGREIMPGLDEDRPEPAYHCGRLLYLLDTIQYAALGSVNATVVDRYYGGASATPSAVFGLLIKNANHHLGRLNSEGNRDEKKRRAHAALRAKLTELMDTIQEFPSSLSLRDQGLFALGFYHQAAADRRAIAERRDARSAALADAQVVPVDDLAKSDS